MQARLWLDLSGITTGSDAAVLVQRLAPALRDRQQTRLVLCRRAPGLQMLGWDAIDALTPPPPLPQRSGRLRPLLHRIAASWPPRTRAVLRQAASQQMTALQALRPPRATPPQPRVVDTALPSAGDTLLLLLPFGDLSRFHAAGVRLALLSADPRPAERPDWLNAQELHAADLWRVMTAPKLTANLGLRDIGAAACLAPKAQRPLPAPGFVLADGAIGLPGKTAELLLAWRSLLDDGGALPLLVLAGPVGDLAVDVLAQLRNSDHFGSSVILWPNPTEGDRAALRAACAFTLALEPQSAWGRATLDSLAAGVPCLSAFSAAGAQPIDPDNATGLARTLRSWIETPPARPAAPTRSWHDVAADVLAWLAP